MAKLKRRKAYQVVLDQGMQTTQIGWKGLSVTAGQAGCVSIFAVTAMMLVFVTSVKL